MNKLALALMIVFTLGIASARAADLKLAYVDLNQAINESDRGKSATKVLEEMVNSKKKIIAEREAELTKLKEEIEKQASVLTQEALKDKQDKLTKQTRDVQIMAKDYQEELQKKEQELTMGIFNDISAIINTIGKDEGYSIIFEKREGGLIYSDKKLDITEKIIKKYNEAASKEKK